VIELKNWTRINSEEYTWHFANLRLLRWANEWYGQLQSL